jgi:signal transduction histidine kinase
MATSAGRLSADAAQIASDVQALSHRLHSSKLEILGLAKTARILCEDFTAQQKITVTFEEIAVPSGIPAGASQCLYRILQESLHNAAKHSDADVVNVRLRGTRDAIELVVQDAGSGFDIESAKASRGIGLVSMQERVNIASGTLSIVSAPGRGTRIEARVPCASN